MMAETQEKPVVMSLSPRQAIADHTLDNLMREGFKVAPEVLYGGAKGGGKSVFMCLRAYRRCMEIIHDYKIGPRDKPIPIGFMGRQRSIDFTDTTLETWQKIIPSTHYQIRTQSKEIVIGQRVKINYGGMDDRDSVNKFNSAEYAFVYLDQAEEISQDDIGMLRGTQRLKINDMDVPTESLFTANPAQCWLKDEFIHHPEPHQRFIQALPTDNPHLHKGYIEQLKKAFQHRPERLEAYLYGNWDALEGADQVIKDQWIRDAYNRTFHKPCVRRLLTCDPARFGDDETVIYRMRNTDIEEAEIYGQKDAMFTANTIHRIAINHKIKAIALDTCGLGGPIADVLRSMSGGAYNVYGVNGAERSVEPDRYYNLRAQIWDRAGRAFSCGDIELTYQDDELRRQLCQPRYDYRNGKILIESKADIKKRLGNSPDRGDAYVNGLYALQYVEGELIGGRGTYSNGFDDEDIYSGSYSAMAM